MLECIDSPPAAVESEQALLSIALSDVSLASIAALQIEDSDLYRTEHRIIWQAIRSLCQNNQHVDITTVASEIKLAGNYSDAIRTSIAQLVDLHVVLHPNSLKYHIEVLKEASGKRHASRAIAEVEGAIAAGELSIAELKALAVEKFSTIPEPRKKQEARTYRSMLQQTLQDFEERCENPDLIQGVATGFEHLDAVLCGLQPGNMIVLAARPGMGKTAMAGNIAVNAARANNRVVLFSLEMSTKELMNRIISSESNIHHQLLKTGRVPEQDKRHIYEAVESAYELPLEIVGNDEPIRTVPDIQARLAELKANGFAADLVIVDYLQLLNSMKETDNINARVSDVSRRIKILASTLGIPIIALAQLSRESEKRKESGPMLSDLRDSGQIEQDADVVMFLHKDKDDANTSDIQLIVKKNRHGPDATIPLVWRPQVFTFITPPRITSILPGY